MSKYKVGDTVRVIGGAKELIGQTSTIKRGSKCGQYLLEDDPHHYIWRAEQLELVKNEQSSAPTTGRRFFHEIVQGGTDHA